jgi:signal transduction histidine kinase
VQDTRQLRFSGPPGTIPRISFAQVLEGNVPPEVFAGKTILVGVTAIGLGDLLPTPVSARGMPMPGVEVQANIWLALRDGRLVSPTTAPVSALLCALLSLLPLLWLARLAPLPGLLVSILWVFVLALVCAVLPELCNFWFDPAGALFSGLCAFPTWSWRRLETARRHFDQELRQLGESLSGHGPNPAREVERMGFEQRIAWLEAAQNRLQELDMQRKEALAFISHDMRSPLANAIQQLESRPVCQSAKLLPSLRRAQAMAQAFLSLARAEALEPGQLKELELAAVLHQAADEVYPLAQQRGQPICRVSLDRPVWVDGDFDSLERCAINLLQNASTYAPANSPIRLGLDRYPGGVRFWVENVGDELGAEQLDRLFKRFSRVESGVGKTGGTGLGLYYVRTVAEKHGGQVGVQWSQGVIRFWVSLPR